VSFVSPCSCELPCHYNRTAGRCQAKVPV